MLLGLDYDGGPIPGAAIRGAGYSFVIRYVDQPGMGSAKCITPAEYLDLQGAGVEVLLVFEVKATDWAGGYAAGVAYARRARAGANAIGYPNNAIIFFTVDMWLSAVDIPTALAYIRGAASVLGPTATGAYGFGDFIAAVQAAGVCGWLWQCGDPPAPGAGVHLWQENNNLGQTIVGGVPCDVDQLLIHMPAPGLAEEDTVALIELPASGFPQDNGGVRWQDTSPASWPRAGEQKTALASSFSYVSSVTCGWAEGDSRKDALSDPVITLQDGPAANGTIKPSGWLDYIRVFYFPDGPKHGNWQVAQLVTNQSLIGNRSLPQLTLPPWSTFLVIQYAAPGGLFLGIE